MQTGHYGWLIPHQISNCKNDWKQNPCNIEWSNTHSLNRSNKYSHQSIINLIRKCTCKAHFRVTLFCTEAELKRNNGMLEWYACTSCQSDRVLSSARIGIKGNATSTEGSLELDHQRLRCWQLDAKQIGIIEHSQEILRISAFRRLVNLGQWHRMATGI